MLTPLLNARSLHLFSYVNYKLSFQEQSDNYIHVQSSVGALRFTDPYEALLTFIICIYAYKINLTSNTEWVFHNKVSL